MKKQVWGESLIKSTPAWSVDSQGRSIFSGANAGPVDSGNGGQGKKVKTNEPANASAVSSTHELNSVESTEQWLQKHGIPFKVRSFIFNHVDFETLGYYDK